MENQKEAFLKDFPKFVSNDELITTISDFALDHGVQILSFSPAQIQGNDFVELASITINISIDDYDKLIQFIRIALESTLGWV